MPKINPPFRADQVGSLLRPKALLDLRHRWKLGEISAEELRLAENEAIAETVKKVESVGMKAITDGEFRRDYFHLDFLKQLDGVTVTGGIASNPNAKVAEDGFTLPKLSVTGKLRHARDIQVEDFNFLKYDDERSGDFAPLRFVPAHKMVVLGLVSSKIPQLETVEELTARINEAAKYMPLDNMCLSPQCGFSSTSHGNA